MKKVMIRETVITDCVIDVAIQVDCARVRCGMGAKQHYPTPAAAAGRPLCARRRFNGW